MQDLSPSQTADLLQAMLNHKVVVVGDVMLDAYIQGDLQRISPEAPVPVLDVQREQNKLGGAANAAKCLVALGAQASVVGIVGDDDDATLFRRQAESLGVSCDGLVVDTDRPTTRKTRIVARKQQVIRVDKEQSGPPTAEVEAQLVASVRAQVAQADAVLISDYGKGVVTEAVARAAIEAAGDKPVLVDPKAVPWTHFSGATVMKPNRLETSLYFGNAITEEADAVAAGRKMIDELGVTYALVTRGSHGMTSVSADGHDSVPVRLPSELADVTGCGDVVAATALLALTAGATIAQAMFLANAAAGVKATKFGAAAVTGPEIMESLGSTARQNDRKVMTRDEAAEFAAQQRAAGRKVVFTNGCFDLLHRGHVDYLEKSAHLGQCMIVGLNTDVSVQRLKGPTRPVQQEQDRAHILASLAHVDAVVLFDEDTPLELIRAVQPDVLTKGADYQRKEDVVGWDLVESWGGRVERIELMAGRSTTGIIGKMNDQ